MDILLSPPIAFLIYIPLVLVIVWIGQKLAGPEKPSEMKSSTYGSGEEAAGFQAAPGYRPFFMIAFFFAILHLSILVLGSGGFTLTTGLYLLGIIIALIALLLG